MRLLAATRNPGKQREIRRVLESFGLSIAFPDELGVPESAAELLLENAETFEGNARRKAEHFLRLTGMPALADDSGLEVYALGGLPGVRSKRWAGAEGTDRDVDAANNVELLRRLAGAPETKRRARYRCVLVLLRSELAVPEVAEGTCHGRILEAPRGSEGFGYDPLFFSDDLAKTFGEATAEEKDAVSHRGRALRALAENLGAT